MRYVIQTPVAYKIEDCDYGQNITDLITFYRKDFEQNVYGYGNRILLEFKTFGINPKNFRKILYFLKIWV